MAKLRRPQDRTDDYFTPGTPNYTLGPSITKPLRIIASGTLFVTHTLALPGYPAPGGVVRAHSVQKTRGGSANLLLSLLAQFPNVESALVAPLGGNEEGRMIVRDLENEGVLTRYCKIWRDAGVPSAWVMHSSEDSSKTVINHNPLPDVTHEDFISLLGPLLAPENYPTPSPIPGPTIHNYGSSPSLAPPLGMSPRPSSSGPRPPLSPSLSNPNSPAPFDWLHFEGRSVKTTLSNITGLDGLARERKWRSHCVFSIDVGRRGRQGVEALIPHADVLFFNKHYAQANSPHYETTPRAFLLSIASLAPPHALLVAHWGTEGGAVLSLPTKEYFQSSGWVEEKPPASPLLLGPDSIAKNASGRPVATNPFTGNVTEIRSVRSGSDFWAGGRSRTPSSRAFTAASGGSQSHYNMSVDEHGNELGRSSEGGGGARARSRSRIRQGGGGRHAVNDSAQYTTMTSEEDDRDSQVTERPAGGGGDKDDSIVDEVGSQDAFIAGMIYALSRRICPGSPYTPSWSPNAEDVASADSDRGRWRLDECLRFATELAGRKARRAGWGGLAEEMIQAGWFDT